jgi:lipid II:glycine glycyltransferase (peptidoglycan interpeptide bridge formation enzyme)
MLLIPNTDTASSQLRAHPVTDGRKWNALLRALPVHHVLQSWEWGEFKARHGWTAERFAFQRGTDVVAAAQMLTRRARPLPVSISYVPKGPALDYADRPLRRAVLDALAAGGRQRGAIFVKIDPDVVLGTGVPGADDEAPDLLGQEVAADLRERQWRFSPEQIQFRNTVQLDLTQSEDALLAAMKQKTRYNVRLSGRKGVRVRAGEDVELLFRLYTETAARDQFAIRPLAYYRDAWGSFLEAGLARALIAECEGEPSAALILFCFGERVWYMYGASLDIHRDRMPNHRLQWEAMRWAKAEGYTVYDMWGAPDLFEESDQMWGVWRFKSGFGGRVVRHIGAWDKILSRPWHRLYISVVPRYLALRRSLRNR